MNRTITITYWWKCEKLSKGIPANLAEALEESAMTRINEMLSQGYVAGELQDNVNMKVKGRKTPQDGWECYGSWNLKKQD